MNRTETIAELKRLRDTGGTVGPWLLRDAIAALEAAERRVAELEREVARLGDAVDIARSNRDAAYSEAAAKVQAIMASLRADNARLSRECESLRKKVSPC